MTKVIHHLGTYQWTNGNGIRPMNGSAEAERREKAEQERLAKLLKTVEGQAWLKRHSTPTQGEDTK